MPDYDESRLPAWVRNRLENLRQRIKKLELDIRDLQTRLPSTGGPITINESALDEFTLPEDTQVKFQLGENRLDTIAFYYERRRHDTLVRVMGSRGVVIRPASSNTFTIELAE